jgi:hypothetical protein
VINHNNFFVSILIFMMIQDIRKRILVIASIVIGVVLALVLFILVIRDRGLSPKSAPNTPETNTGTPAVKNSPKPNAKTVEPVGEPEEIYLRQLARIFVERFGSFSNQNDNQHIVDALALSTKRMQSYIQSKEISFNSSYEGVTTIVVASHVVKRNQTTATVTVDVQRIVRTLGTEKTEYQTGTVGFSKEGGEWKVGSLFWK